LRAEKDCIQWALVEGSGAEPVLLNDGKFAAPITYDEPKALAWYRERIKTMVDEFKPKTVAVRYPETYLRFKPKAPSSFYARIRIEGVIVEAAQSSGVRVETGAWATLSSRLGSKSAKAYLESGELRGLDLSTKPDNRREAIIAAVAGLEG